MGVDRTIAGFGNVAATTREHGVEVPYARLAADVLRRVAEEFVTRDGTDYGTTERTLDEKVAAVRRELERGEAVIVYETESETINIVRTGGSNGRQVAQVEEPRSEAEECRQGE